MAQGYCCKFCHKLLFKINDIHLSGRIEIKCPKCKKINEVEDKDNERIEK